MPAHSRIKRRAVINMTEKDLTAGRVVRHFKRGMLSEQERANSTKYLYEIIGIAEHTESGERLVIYRALYGSFGIYARPVEMFLSATDRKKYPDAKQNYRFEPID